MIFGMSTAWRWLYAAGMVATLYFLVSVLIAQAFTKAAVLKAAAPTLSEPPFAITQLVALLAFVLLAIAAIRAFGPAAAIAARR